MFVRLRKEAYDAVQQEPILCMLFSKVGLLDASTVKQLSSANSGMIPPSCIATIEPAKSFEEIVARIVAHRLSSCSGGNESICPKFLRNLLEESFNDELEMGHTMSYAVRRDALAIYERDPAIETLLEAVLFMKGFHSLVIHRAARRAWKPVATPNNENGNDIEQAKCDDSNLPVSGKRFVALLLQSQASSAFGVDIHPASSIGAGVMIDHASGVVIGETATVGDGTTILHGVTLGGTGKDKHKDRHPKIGKHVLIGAGTKILGNITVGDRCKIGAGSVVLRPIPGGATAVGAPAKIIGFIPNGENPGATIDMKLESIEPLLGMGKKVDSISSTESTMDSTSTDATADATTNEERKATEREDSEEEETKEYAHKEEEKKVSDEDEGEDDDEVTDYGTKPKCRWKDVSSHKNDRLCPFSGSFRDVSKSISGSCFSHEELRALLIQEGCSEGECVEVFFALLHTTPPSSKERQCGCIPLNIFQRFFPSIAKEKTKLDEETIHALATGDLRALGMSKKASRRFKSAFGRLGKGSFTQMPRIPSSGSLSMDKVPSKCFKEEMGKHLNTASYSDYDYCV